MSPDEIKKLVAAMKEEAEIRQRINESSAEYLKLLKDIKAINKNIADIEATYAEQLEKVKAARKAMAGLSGKALKDAREALDLEIQKAKIIRTQKNELKESAAQMTKIAKEAGNLTKSLGAFTQIKKDVTAISTTVKKGYNVLKGWAGLFEIDKSIRMSALNMGLLDKQTKNFRDNLFYAGQNTIQFGVDIGELAELQAKFSDELGRTVMLSEKGLVSMAAMSKATGLGAEGAAQLAAEFDRQGISAENTAEFMEQTMNDASKMGLNASKVAKNIQQNMKMLNRYNFKGGVNGLKKMAESMTKLGLDLNMAAPMAEKLFDIEGAVDMSAQLQVLGGEWSKLADPFHLMYMARNDMEGLTKEITDATAASAHWSSVNKKFEISALEMQRLRKIAEATGLDFDQLSESARKAAQFAGIRKQINYGFDPATKEFIESTAQFNDKGEAFITVNGEPKLVKQLNSMDKTTLENLIAEKKTLKERAESAQTFDETLKNLVNQIKSLLLPVLEGLDTTLRPVLKKFTEAIADKKFLETIKGFGEWIGKAIGAIGKFIVENPKWSLALFGVFEAAKWIANGVALGTGFNMSVGKGGLLSGLKNIFSKGGTASAASMAGTGSQFAGGSFSAGKKLLSKPGGKFMAGTGGKMLGGAAGGLLAGGIDSIDAFSEGKTGEGIGNIAGGAIGGALGTLLDPFLGPFGTLLGGWLGSKAGGWVGGLFDEGEETTANKVNDGVLFNPRDKFLKLNDGAMIAGTNANGNKDLANAIMSANIGGNTNSTNNSNPISKIEFGEISINGKIMVETPGSPNMGVDLLKHQPFLTELSQKLLTQIDVMVHQKAKG